MRGTGIDALKAAIVRQACEDYLWLLKHPGKKIDCGTDERGKRRLESIKTLTRWFRSDAFRGLCGVDGGKIIAQLNLNHANGIRFYPLEQEKEAA